MCARPRSRNEGLPPAASVAVDIRNASQRIKTAAICCSLALITLMAFWPVTTFDFINFDDGSYITQNKHVLQGLSWDGALWAFKTGHSANWHPLTWLSHMLDVQLFGGNAGRHHLTNLIFHTANTLLVFLVLKQMTGAVWRSAFAAALFGVHPLRVESVAWVSERKDVLSGLFFLLTLWAYVRYVQATRERVGLLHPKAPLTYLLVALTLFALGLMSKPMLVTTPFVLLLLDYWPLRRIAMPREKRVEKTNWKQLVLEKVPFLVLAAFSCLVTFLVQQHGRTVLSVEALPLVTRLENAAVAYIRYFGKLIWPANLAIPYPYVEVGPAAAITALMALLAIGAAAVRMAGKWPSAAVGMFWFLGMLVPVIGLVQVGPQAMADRYTYLPSLGLFIAVCWFVPDWLKSWPRFHPAAGFVALLALLLCTVITRRQAAYWKSSETLFRHAVEVTPANYVAHDCLGDALAEQGRDSEARAQFAAAMRIKPNFPHTLCNMGKLLYDEKKFAEAGDLFNRALQINPEDPETLQNLACTLAARGELDEAIVDYQRALALAPNYDEARANLASALTQRAQWDAAATHYENGAALLQRKQPREAIEEFHAALRSRPEWPEVMNNLAWLLATHPSVDVRDGAEAVSLAERVRELTGGTNLWMMSTLAAAYAETGRRDEAVAVQQKVYEMATGLVDSVQLELFQRRIESYRAGQAFHEP